MCIILNDNYLISLNKRGIGTGTKVVTFDLETRRIHSVYCNKSHYYNPLNKWITFDSSKPNGSNGFSVIVGEDSTAKAWDFITKHEAEYISLNIGKELLMYEVKFKNVIEQGFWSDHSEVSQILVTHLLFRRIIKRFVFPFNYPLYPEKQRALWQTQK